MAGDLQIVPAEPPATGWLSARGRCHKAPMPGLCPPRSPLQSLPPTLELGDITSQTSRLCPSPEAAAQRLLGSFRAHTTPGINTSNFTCIFSRNLTIYFHPDFSYLLARGEQPTLLVSLCPLPTVLWAPSPLSLSHPNFPAPNFFCSLQNPQGT